MMRISMMLCCRLGGWLGSEDRLGRDGGGVAWCSCGANAVFFYSGADTIVQFARETLLIKSKLVVYLHE
jgi:hypothetical protein